MSLRIAIHVFASLDFQYVNEKLDGASLHKHCEEDDDERGREEDLLVLVVIIEDLHEGEADGAAEAAVRQDHLLPPRDLVQAAPDV